MIRPESAETAAALLLNFGEPESPALDEVVPFLEAIFTANARLEPHETAEDAAVRSRELALRRAPGLVEAYESIGGSPLNAQAADQAAALRSALEARGETLSVAVGMQFTKPSIDEALEQLRANDPDTLVLVPVYPLCGPSTTVAALTSVQAGLRRASWHPRTVEITGWHRHPGYVRYRADATRRTAEGAGLDLNDPDVRLVFSAHGTPLRYVRDGSRYVEYVEEWCDLQAEALGVRRWTLGYQNHSNRRIEWTEPSIEEALGSLSETRAIVVDPISFMHEQSETLVELDVDLAAEALELGLEFHRVPIDHEASMFVEVLADLVIAALGGHVAGIPELRACRCKPGADVCFNGEPLGPPRRGESTP